MRNYSGVYEVSRVSALRSESEAAQTVPIRDFQSLKPAFLRDPLNAYHLAEFFLVSPGIADLQSAAFVFPSEIALGSPWDRPGIADL
ncbi:MAG: hypothetical protein ACO331_00455 [Prochlorothrix sp.]